MIITDQKKLRIIISYVVIFLLIGVSFFDLSDLLKFAESTKSVILGLAFVVGVIHHFFIGPRIYSTTWKKIQAIIIKKIEHESKEAKIDLNSISKDKKMRAFYTVVDSHPSLVNLSNQIRDNGTFLTTFLDIQFYSGILILIKLLIGLLQCSFIPSGLIIIAFLLACCALSYFFANFFYKRHAKMVSEQFSEISTHHKKDLIKRLKELGDSKK